MALWTELLDPVNVTDYVRRTREARDRSNTLGSFLPDEYVPDTVVRFNRTERGLVPMAEYRAWDTETTPQGADKGERVTAELPPITAVEKLTERETVRPLLSGQAGSETQIARILNRLSQALEDRLEYARGQALVDGQVTINENGLLFTVDYDRDADMTVTAATKWDQSNANPVDDLLGWAETYTDKNGTAPEVMLAPRALMGKLQRNGELIKMNTTARASVGVLQADQINATFQAYGLPSIVFYDRKVRTATGVSQRILPAEKIVLLPGVDAGDIGRTFFGPVAEADDPEYFPTGTPGPGAVGSLHREDNSYGIRVRINCTALPVLRAPNLAMAATVL